VSACAQPACRCRDLSGSGCVATVLQKFGYQQCFAKRDVVRLEEGLGSAAATMPLLLDKRTGKPGKPRLILAASRVARLSCQHQQVYFTILDMHPIGTIPSSHCRLCMIMWVTCHWPACASTHTQKAFIPQQLATASTAAVSIYVLMLHPPTLPH
jgi:hypothetical protein